MMLLLQALYAVQKWKCDLQTISLRFELVFRSRVVYRSLHLANRLDKALGLFGEVMFLFGDRVELIVEGL